MGGARPEKLRADDLILFDTETNGLLDAVTKVHCLVIKDRVSGEVFRYRGSTIEEGIAHLLDELDKGRIIGGHNVIGFDIPVLCKLYDISFTKYQPYVRDSLVETRLIWSDLSALDAKLIKKGQLPAHLRKSHSLEAWGARLKRPKDDYAKRMKEKGLDPWAEWSQEMEDYCVQDVDTNEVLFDRIDARNYSQEALALERDVAFILARQTRYGFGFDEAAAGKLYAQLVARRTELEAQLSQSFLPFYVRDGATVTTKRSRKVQTEELGVIGVSSKGVPKYRTMDYEAETAFCKVKQVSFNPNSNDHVADRLKKLFGWAPMEFTPTGKAKIDDVILSDLPYPEAAPLKEHAVVTKRIAQLAEGSEAWLKRSKNGRIYGSVITNGAVTGRMTHSRPNMAQVPAGYSPYGPECRALFIAQPGKVLVGADAAALELRDLAGYMARFDGGAYVETVLRGDKKQGTDIHSVNAKALGLDPNRVYFEGETGRDLAKTWFYAFLYGAGDEKLGFILHKKKGLIQQGKKSRAKFMASLPALGTLVTRIKAKAKSQKYLLGLDGRELHVRSQHAAPNTLLQAAGAIQMKRALCILDSALQQQEGLKPGIDYEFVANVHDEWQIECNENLGDLIGKHAVSAIRAAGEYYNFRCPLDGEYKIGRSWADTH